MNEPLKHLNIWSCLTLLINRIKSYYKNKLIICHIAAYFNEDPGKVNQTLSSTPECNLDDWGGATHWGGATRVAPPTPNSIGL